MEEPQATTVTDESPLEVKIQEDEGDDNNDNIQTALDDDDSWKLEPDDPWDQEGWITILDTIHSKGVEHAHTVYERFFELYPTAAKYWRGYANSELEQQNYPMVDDIFKRSLQLCPHLDLWRPYIRYVCMKHGAVPRSASVTATATAAAAPGSADSLSYLQTTAPQRDSIERAFEFCLEHVGHDVGAASLWLDYIAFLLEKPVLIHTAHPHPYPCTSQPSPSHPEYVTPQRLCPRNELE
eukprot:c11903_g1_i4.p1 GENE.c11903_g1_i4~~c11903_g1_i4.p1  ORF type:complete len:252 (-),score=54.38 c11903_g1_i4:538-1254(-)